MVLTNLVGVPEVIIRTWPIVFNRETPPARIGAIATRMLWTFCRNSSVLNVRMLIFSKVKLGVTPDINALATIIVVVVTVGVVCAGIVMMRAERRRQLDEQQAHAQAAAPAR